MGSLADLAALLSVRVDPEGAWSATSDEVRESLGLPPVDFWRAVHAQRDRIAFGEAIDGFTEDTAGELVLVLEALGFSDAEAVLARAGVFIPHRDGVDLAEEFLTDAGRFCAAHEIQVDELEAMVRYARSVRAAVGIYFGEHVSRDVLIDSCSDRWCLRHRLSEPGPSTAARYLRTLFARHILDPQAVFAVLVERLKLAAALRGFVDPEERERERRRARPAGAAAESRTRGGRSWALQVMGLDPAEADAATLRARYRQLMMRHHPDVDPSGLERCKDVNAAYSVLVMEASRA